MFSFSFSSSHSDIDPSGEVEFVVAKFVAVAVCTIAGT